VQGDPGLPSDKLARVQIDMRHDKEHVHVGIVDLPDEPWLLKDQGHGLDLGNGVRSCKVEEEAEHRNREVLLDAVNYNYNYSPQQWT